jgi:hypothetical protein
VPKEYAPGYAMGNPKSGFANSFSGSGCRPEGLLTIAPPSFPRDKHPGVGYLNSEDHLIIGVISLIDGGGDNQSQINDLNLIPTAGGERTGYDQEKRQ